MASAGRPTIRRRVPSSMKQQRVKVMTAAHYRVMADIINEIVDPTARQAAADAFATGLRKRYPGFNPVSWAAATGGRVRGFNIHTGQFEATQ
jgi:hypothetical protein